MIKPDEMIDMRMRDADKVQALDLPRRQTGDVAEIEQDRTPFKQRFDIERRIPGASVDQAGMQERAHGCAGVDQAEHDAIR